MPVYKWSQTAANNATADSTINWAEGQAPSSVNDSARAMMAATAKYRDDISGAIVTAGTSTAYTVSSNQVFDTLAHLDGQMIAFTPHATNGATVTLNVDGLGAKPLRTAPSAELLAGTLVLGTPYIAVYNNTAGAFYLQGFYGNAYNIPLGAGIDYWGSTAPNSSFVFPYGQAISRTTYASLYSLIGTTYGTGDGSTTFNLPDKRGRVSAALDTMGGTSADRLSPAITSGILGSNGGSQDRTLTTSNLPAYTPSGSITNGAITSTPNLSPVVSGSGPLAFGSGSSGGLNSLTVSSTQATSTFTGTAQGGTSTAFTIVQPTIVCNYIIRVI